MTIPIQMKNGRPIGTPDTASTKNTTRHAITIAYDTLISRIRRTRLASAS